MYPLSPLIVIAAALALVPYFAAAFFPSRFGPWVRGLPAVVQVFLPASLCIPYVLVAVDRHLFSPRWLALYIILPVAMAALMALSRAGGKGRGCWMEFVVLAVLDRKSVV